MSLEILFYLAYLAIWIVCLTYAGIRGWLIRENVVPLLTAVPIAIILAFLGLYLLDIQSRMAFEICYVLSLAILYALFRRKRGLRGSPAQFAVLVGSVLPLGTVLILFLLVLFVQIASCSRSML